MEGERRTSMIYSASYSHGKGGDNKYILAGATGAFNEVKMFSTANRRVSIPLYHIERARVIN
jgi:hypothetical protein